MTSETAGAPNGPFVNVAAFCQYALQEKDDAITAVRIVDRVTLAVDEGDQADAAGTSAPLQLWAVIVLQPGALRGSHNLTVRPTTPTADQSSPWEFPIFFPEDGRGVQVLVNMSITVTREGTSNFDVYVDDQFLTRMPLRVAFTRQLNSGAKA